MSILNHFPYSDMRQLQKDVLLQLQKSWNDYDVFVIVAPTAAGKSALSVTIANWAKDSRILVPNNMLVTQLAREFDSLNPMMGYSNYICNANESNPIPCKQKQTRCAQCPMNRAINNFNSRVVTVCNMHLHATLVARNKYKNAAQTLIIDEAHTLIPVIQDISSLSIWKHKQNFPAHNASDKSILAWLKGLSKPTNAQKKLLWNLQNPDKAEYIIEEGEGEWSGGGYDIEGNKLIIGEPVILPQIKLVPVDISRMTSVMFPDRTQKIVLMSATIGKKDVEALGLHRKRVRYLECKHPIPANNRPIISDYVASVNYNNFDQSTKDICEHINRHMLPFHAGQKGLIHATYKQADIMRRHLTHPRYLFHTAENKKLVYQQFLDSDPKDGKVLVASGMYEGLDLPEDLGRWQVITKIPWKSLASNAVRHKANKDEQWYQWQTLKDVIQACGRICRTPTDYGVTYILDKSFQRLENNELLPMWFLEAWQSY